MAQSVTTPPTAWKTIRNNLRSIRNSTTDPGMMSTLPDSEQDRITDFADALNATLGQWASLDDNDFTGVAKTTALKTWLTHQKATAPTTGARQGYEQALLTFH